VVRWAAVILGLHALLVVWMFPARHATPDDPFATNDTSFYYASGLAAAEGGRLTGFSPDHLAGYPYGSWMSLGRKGFEAAMLWGPGANPAVRYYRFLLLTALLTPIVIGLAALALGLSRRASVIVAAAAAIAYTLADPLSSFPAYGGTAFPFACALTVLAAALCWQPTAKRALTAGLVAGVALWVHEIAAVPLVAGLLAVAITPRDDPAGRRWASVVGALLLAALLVVPGHWSLLSQLDLRLPMRPHFNQGGLRWMVMDLLDDRAYSRPYDRRLMLHALLILATWQFFAERAGRRQGLAALWVAAMLCLAVAWPLGGLPGVRELQPYRFLAAAELSLIPPACYGLRRLIEAIRDANTPGRAAILVLGLAMLPALTGTVLDLHERQPMGGLSEEERQVVDWVRDWRGSGRIGCEPDALGNLLPSLAGYEVIGGGISRHSVLVQNWADISSDWSFGQPNEDLSPDTFMRACGLLDIRVLIVSSPSVIKLVEYTPAQLTAQFGQLRVYSLAAEPPAAIWSGCYAGWVTAEPNRIRIGHAPSGRFVLNYHFVAGCRTPDGVTVSPVDVEPAKAPLLAVDNASGLGTIELRWGAAQDSP